MRGALKGLCIAYCEANDCDTANKPGCASLLRNYRKHSQGAYPPCAAPPQPCVPVDDANACTLDGCDAYGNPTHTPIVPDDDHNACTTDGCDPVVGSTHTPVDPDDGNACTTETCDPGTGVSNTPVPVDDGSACITDACDPESGISHTPNDSLCDDEDPCTSDLGTPRRSRAAVRR